MNILFELPPQAQWLEILQEAQSIAGYHFSDDVTHYLLITLENQMTQLTLASTMLAFNYLEAHDHSPQVKNRKLRHVGDECLIIAGLFPDVFKKKNISPNYIIQLGKNAYHHIAQHSSQANINQPLYHVLSTYFVELTNTLRMIRPLSAVA